MLRASMERQGIQVPFTEICGDDKEILKKQLKKALDVADIVITTGGVSVGKKDLLPEVLEELGAKKYFPTPTSSRELRRSAVSWMVKSS